MYSPTLDVTKCIITDSDGNVCFNERLAFHKGKVCMLDKIGLQWQGRQLSYFLQDASLSLVIRDHPFKTPGNFHDFWLRPPPVGSFYTPSIYHLGCTIKGKHFNLTEQFDWVIFKSKTFQKMHRNYIFCSDLHFLLFWTNANHDRLLLVYCPQNGSCDFFTSYNLWNNLYFVDDVVYWPNCSNYYYFHWYL